MPTFTYKALKKEDGTSYETTVEAKDRFEVYGIVRKEGGQIISVKEIKSGGAFVARANACLGKVKTTEKIMLMRNLGSMLEAGLTVSRALNVMERQTKNQKLQSVLADIKRAIEQGDDLNSSMAKQKKVFSPLMVAMVKSGEESGTLAEACHLVADQTERNDEMKKKVRGAMIYPGVILSVLFVVGILMMMYVVPSLAEAFESLDAELPTTTKIVLGISDFVVNYTLLVLLGIVVSIGLFMMTIRTKNGKYAIETIVLRIPVVGVLVKETNSARTTRTLSSLLTSGVHVIQALEITQEVIQNTHYRVVIKKAAGVVQKGSPIAEVFMAEETLYPPLVGELIAVGEETGNLPHMLKEVAIFYEKAVDRKTKNMSTIIEPFLMLIVGIGVGFFALAMISPIYSITSSI